MSSEHATEIKTINNERNGRLLTDDQITRKLHRNADNARRPTARYLYKRHTHKQRWQETTRCANIFSTTASTG